LKEYSSSASSTCSNYTSGGTTSAGVTAITIAAGASTSTKFIQVITSTIPTCGDGTVLAS
jgi:hypothetical protein